MGAFTRATTATRSRSIKAVVSSVAIIGASVLILSGCSTGGTSSTSASDLTLKLGTILPQTGSLATLGPPTIEAVNLAVSDINAAKKGITLSVTQKDSGDTTTNIATQSVTSLLTDGVSAIIGAESSSVSLTVIDQIAKANVVQLSPANTSPKLSTYPDNGFYWRTAPSDVLQGKVLGEKVVKDGATNVAILYQNDSYGQGLNDNVQKAILAQGAKVAADVSFDPAATSFSTEVSSIIASKPDAIVAITFDQIKQIVPLLKTAGWDFSKFYGSDGNYGVIDPTFTDVDIAGAQFTNPGVNASADFQAQINKQATADGAKPVTVFSYGPESYDGVVVLALAALQGKATDGVTLKNNLQSVTTGANDCKSFSECADLIKAGKPIHYQGLSGPISFDKNGDPTQAYISIYKYGKGNTNAFVSAEFGDLSK